MMPSVIKAKGSRPFDTILYIKVPLRKSYGGLFFILSLGRVKWCVGELGSWTFQHSTLISANFDQSAVLSLVTMGRFMSSS